MKPKYTHRLDRISFYNRWMDRFPHCDWTIVGIHERWFSPLEYEYKICFFGLDIRIWMKRTQVNV